MPRILVASVLAALTCGVLQAQLAFVYQVNVGSCSTSPKDRSQTGFRVKNSEHKGIVTALHGVAGCSVISAKSGAGKFYRDLQIRFVDVGRDTALLSSATIENESADGLPVDPSVPWNALPELVVYGHPYGSSQGGVRLQARFPALRALDAEVGHNNIAVKLQNRGSPGITSQILSLQGPLGPGDSGAPILANGKLIAVANGGLMGGAANLGWAIPYEEIALVPAYPSDLIKLSQLPVEGLFSFEGTNYPPPPPPPQDSLKRVIDGRGRVAKSWFGDAITGSDLHFVSLVECVLKIDETDYVSSYAPSKVTINIPLSEINVGSVQCDCDPSGNLHAINLVVKDGVQDIKYEQSLFGPNLDFYRFYVDGKTQTDTTVKAFSEAIAACKK